MFSQPRRGFSLVELLIVLAISTVIGSAIVTSLMSQMQLSSTQNRTIINQQNIRETLDYMGDEISSIGAGTSEPFIDIASAQELRFVSDIDGDGDWNRIRYYLSSGSLRRQLWSSTDSGLSWTAVSDDVLLTGVSALSFTYSKRGNTAPANNDEITLVEVRLTQNAASDTTAFNSGRVATNSMAIRATIRNRML